MIREYIAAAMKRGRYEILADDGTYYGEIPGGTYYGEIPGFEGVFAMDASQLEEAPAAKSPAHSGPQARPDG